MKGHRISLRINREIYNYFQDKIGEGSSVSQLFSPILSTFDDSNIICEPLGFNHDLNRSLFVPDCVYVKLEKVASGVGVKVSQVVKIVLIMLYINGKGKGRRV